MAVLSASRAYPRGGAPRRTYTPGAPLFAKMAMKFRGVEYKRGDVLPVEQMSKHKHWELWTCGKADHSTSGPFDKLKAVAPDKAAAPEAPLDPTPVAVAFDTTEGEHVEVETPTQQKKRKQRASQSTE